MSDLEQRDDMFGVIDLVTDQRLQLEVRDQVLLSIRNLLGPEGHEVSLDALPALVAQRLRLVQPIEPLANADARIRKECAEDAEEESWRVQP